jgi:glycosyltransferase involved in cell wall biosynthesis
MNSKNNSAIRVIMLLPSLPPMAAGGAEMQALRLGKKLMEKGVAIRFVTPGKGNIKGRTDIEDMPVMRLYSFASRLFEFLSELKKKNTKKITKIEYDDARDKVDEIDNPVGWPTVLYYNIFYLHCLLFLWPKRNEFDIIHTHTMEWPAIVSAKLGKALKKKVIIKDSTMNGFKSLLRYPSGAKLQRFIIDHSCFVAMTAVIEKNLLAEGIPEEKISRIPNGIEISDLKKGDANSNTGMNVLFVGNLYQQPAKGIDILLKAWVGVNKKFPDAKLFVVGEGFTQAYIEFTKQLGIENSIQFEGKQSDLSKYYASASIFVLPSRREGMSNALMEAMLWGLPCIATNISGNNDLIEHSKNGWLVPVADISSLTNAICHLLSEPVEAHEMGLEARVTIKDRVNIDIIADKYIALYKRIVKL